MRREVLCASEWANICAKETHQEINLGLRKIHSKKLLESLYFKLLQLFLAKINS